MVSLFSNLLVIRLLPLNASGACDDGRGAAPAGSNPTGLVTTAPRCHAVTLYRPPTYATEARGAVLTPKAAVRGDRDMGEGVADKKSRMRPALNFVALADTKNKLGCPEFLIYMGQALSQSTCGQTKRERMGGGDPWECHGSTSSRVGRMKGVLRVLIICRRERQQSRVERRGTTCCTALDSRCSPHGVTTAAPHPPASGKCNWWQRWLASCR
jgi:hypothetical protein|mmetsp:Transcript_9842/g.18595  ORF Transcript_9842/g.18595 Transcript_9842/m.18595 type:complete len:213 (+) Transcript_9842:1397-2035(+)